MNWYNDDVKRPLNYDKPIIAESKDGDKYLLLPQISKNNGYKIIGYNWFRIVSGRYNSSCFFGSVAEAIGDYSEYKIYNADIVIKP